jgi:hypothetical protein
MSISVNTVNTTTTTPLPNWITVVAGTNHLPILNTDYGWDSIGVWTVNDTIGRGMEGISYPFRTTFTISTGTISKTTVDFMVTDVTEIDAGFGIGVFASSTSNPIWDWDSTDGNTSANRIGAQYNGTRPELHGISGGAKSFYNLPGPGTYRARLTVIPSGGRNLDIKLETLDISNDENVLDTINYTETLFDVGSYRIGFASDQDNNNPRTYFKNLSIDINHGATNYTDALTSGTSISTATIVIQATETVTNGNNAGIATSIAIDYTSYYNRIATALETIATNSKIMKDLAQGPGIHMVGPWEYINLYQSVRMFEQDHVSYNEFLDKVKGLPKDF